VSLLKNLPYKIISGIEFLPICTLYCTFRIYRAALKNPADEKDSQLLSQKEIAAFLDISLVTLTYWMRRPKFATACKSKPIDYSPHFLRRIAPLFAAAA
jgi:hypothetical protein